MRLNCNRKRLCRMNFQTLITPKCQKGQHSLITTRSCPIWFKTTSSRPTRIMESQRDLEAFRDPFRMAKMRRELLPRRKVP